MNQLIRKEAIRINRDKKNNLIGTIIRGIAAEPSWERYGYTMVYPLGEGPIMTVQGGYSSGTILQIHVTEVLSAGLVGGQVIHNNDLK